MSKKQQKPKKLKKTKKPKKPILHNLSETDDWQLECLFLIVSGDIFFLFFVSFFFVFFDVVG